MYKDNIDYKTKCRALFVLTLSEYYQVSTTIDDSFFNLFHSYMRDRIYDKKITIDEAYLLLYFKRNGFTFKAYESEKTISNLFNELDSIKTYGDLSTLYNDIKQKDIEKITDLAMDFIEYMEAFNKYNDNTNVYSFLKQ